MITGDLFKAFYLASDDIVSERLDICNNCPELTKMRRCKKCGCFMIIKSKLKSSVCPERKW